MNLGRLFEWLYEEVMPTWVFYPFGWAMIFGLLFLGGRILFLLGVWEIFPAVWSAIFSAVVASAVTYYQLVKETGCPNCKHFLPFQRREMSREPYKQFEKQSVSHEYQTNYYDDGLGKLRERSWDRVTIRVFKTYKVQYTCKHCEQEWEETEDVLQKTFVRENEQPPRKYRPIE